MKISDEDELKYTEKVIGVNFSNYSAWHNRRYAKNLLFRQIIMVMVEIVMCFFDEIALILIYLL